MHRFGNLEWMTQLNQEAKSYLSGLLQRFSGVSTREIIRQPRANHKAKIIRHPWSQEDVDRTMSGDDEDNIYPILHARELLAKCVLYKHLKQQPLHQGDLILFDDPKLLHPPVYIIVGNSLEEVDNYVPSSLSWPQWPLEYWSSLGWIFLHTRPISSRSIWFRNCPYSVKGSRTLLVQVENQWLDFQVDNAELVGQLLTGVDSEPISVEFQKTQELEGATWRIKYSLAMKLPCTSWQRTVVYLAYPTGQPIQHDLDYCDDDLHDLALATWITLERPNGEWQRLNWHIQRAQQLFQLRHSLLQQLGLFSSLCTLIGSYC